MANQQKIDIVNQAIDEFKNSQGIYFTRYTGMSVPQITELRKAFSSNSVNYKVIKNTLTKIAAKEAGYEGKFDELLENQVAIAFSEDPVAPARVIKDFLKEIEGLDYKNAYKILNKKLKDLDCSLPPLIGAYMNLSSTMRSFGTAMNNNFGEVEETGILISIKDIYPEKKDRHIDSYLKQLKELWK